MKKTVDVLLVAAVIAPVVLLFCHLQCGMMQWL